MPARITAALPRVTSSESALHVELVSAIVEKNRAYTTGFRSALADWIRRVDLTYARGGEDEIRIPALRPDCYRLENGVLTIWEAEVTCSLSHKRFRDWVWLWGDLDASDLYLDMDLRIVDKTGFEHVTDMVAASHDDLRGSLANWIKYCTRAQSDVSYLR